AMAAAKRAAAALAGGEVEPTTQARVEQALADLELVRRLEDIRLETNPLTANQFDSARADQRYADKRYAATFRNAGIDVERLSARTAVERLQSQSGVTVALVVALDNWANVRRRAKDRAGARALTEIAQETDADPWRRRVREALLRGDRKALLDLATVEEVF